MDAEADQMCEATGNSRNGYGPRTLKTCVGAVPECAQAAPGQLLPRGRHHPLPAGRPGPGGGRGRDVHTGTSARKVQRVTERMGVSRLSKDQVSAIARARVQMAVVSAQINSGNPLK